MDYYQILGITKNANGDEIKQAYRKLALKYHPDKNQGNKEAEKKFKEINEAYEVLKDSEKKANYDRMGHSAFTAGGGNSAHGYSSQYSNFHNVNDIFADFFSDFMGSSGGRNYKRSIKERGSDLSYNLTITLEEAFSGIDKDIKFATEVQCGSCFGSGSKDSSSTTSCKHCSGRGVMQMRQGFITFEQTCNHCGGSGQKIQNPCTTCRGNGRVSGQKKLLVKIPAGVSQGMKIRLSGEGEAGMRGGTSGDLYVVVNVKPHNIFKPDGNNLYCNINIHYPIAALGGDIEIPVIEGGKINFRIPAATQNSQVFTITGRGMPSLRSSNRGNLIIAVNIEVPKKLTEKQKHLLEEFAHSLYGGHAEDKKKEDKIDDKESKKKDSEESKESIVDKIKKIWP